MTLKRRIHRLQGGGRTVLWDSFTGADGEELTSHAPDSGAPWTYPVQGSNPNAIVSSNRLSLNTTGNQSGHGVAGSRLRRRNGEVSCDVIRTGAGQATAAMVGVVVRTNLSTPRKGYWVRYQLTNAVTAWQVIRDITVAQVGSNVVQALTQDQAYRLRVAFRGAVILVFVDNVLIARADDGGQGIRGLRVGLRNNNSAALSDPPLKIDNWMATR